MKKHKFCSIIILALFILVQFTASAQARTWKEWSKGTGIILTLFTSRAQVNPGEAVSLSASGSDMDAWVEWEQEDVSNPPPPERKAQGQERDTLNLPVWSCTGGSLSSRQGQRVFWIASDEPGSYTITVNVSDRGTRRYQDGTATQSIGIRVVPSEKDQIGDALDKLKQTEWAKTEAGKEVIEMLEDAYRKGKIKNEDTEGARASYDPDTGQIVIDEDTEEKEIPGRLAHEGTHAQQDKEGRLDSYGYEDEREAYDAGHAVDKEMEVESAYNPTDEEIKIMYGF